MKDREIMEESAGVIEVLLKFIPTPPQTAVDHLGRLKARIKQLKEQEDWYSMPKESRDKIRMAAMGNRNLWKPELDAPFQKAKELRACGMLLKDALAAAGLTVDQWYRRCRIEKNGRDR